MEEWNSRLANPELRCKNKCGFYGNPIYQGYCSKCFKEVTKRDTREKVLEDEAEGNSLGFTKFPFKKITGKGQHKILKASYSPMKKTTKSSSAVSGNNPPGWETTSLPVPSTNSQQEPQKKKSKGNGGPRSTDPFNEFMKTLKKPAAQDIVQHLKTFKKQVHERSTATVGEQSEMVQSFYEAISQRLTTHPLFNQMSEEEQDEMMDGIEKHLMTSIYTKVFSPASCDDEVKDILLLRRINMLHWLKPSDLDVALDMDSLEVQGVFEQAREELWNMENKKAPQDKLNCICRSCTKLFEALRISQGGPASADEFLPALIFLIIHTSCQHIYSNMNYIERFSQPVRLMSGESGYYFTNLCGAVMFIDNISAENLKMTQEEFDSKMGYVDGKTDADLLIEELDIEEDYERIVVLQSCCAAMGELTNHVQAMCSELDDLEEQMKDFHSGVKQQATAILSRPPPRSLYKRNSPLGGHTPFGSNTPHSNIPPPVPQHGLSSSFNSATPPIQPPYTERQIGSSLHTSPLPSRVPPHGVQYYPSSLPATGVPPHIPLHPNYQYQQQPPLVPPNDMSSSYTRTSPVPPVPPARVGSAGYSNPALTPSSYTRTSPVPPVPPARVGSAGYNNPAVIPDRDFSSYTRTSPVLPSHMGGGANVPHPLQPPYYSTNVPHPLQPSYSTSAPRPLQPPYSTGVPRPLQPPYSTGVPRPLQQPHPPVSNVLPPVNTGNRTPPPPPPRRSSTSPDSPLPLIQFD